MTNPELRHIKYREHVQALDDHKALVEKLHQPDSGVHMDDIKFSLEKMALTLEEYFKVIGIP